MNFRKRILSFLASSFGLALMSVSNTLAVPDYFVYFVGGENHNNRLINKSCCMCKKNLVERCLQFCCNQGCVQCAEEMQNACHCYYCKHIIINEIKRNGYFCFVDRDDVDTDYIIGYINDKTNNNNNNDNDRTLRYDDYDDDKDFEYVYGKNKLLCAYCMKKRLEESVKINKDVIIMGPFEESDLVGNKHLDDNCSVCHKKLIKENVSQQLTYCTKCGYIFHYGCILDWFIYQDQYLDHRTCPRCECTVIMAKKYGKKSNIEYLPDELNLLNRLFRNLPTTNECDDCQDNREFMDMFDNAINNRE